MPPHLTQEQRARIYTLFHDAKWTHKQLREHLGVSEKQVRLAIKRTEVAPRSGRPLTMSADDDAELEAYITQSRERRRMPFYELSIRFQGGIRTIKVLRGAFQRLGFFRRVARCKPKLDERSARRRLLWALEHRSWTPEQWSQILWSDVTWVTGGTHRQQYVSRRIGEENHRDCVTTRPKKQRGWMFWGSFSGVTGKGPAVVWNKDWGDINGATYREHILPVIEECLEKCRRDFSKELVFMQDNAPGSAAKETIQDFINRNVPVMHWPANSPDLHPIETVWNWMKDWLEDVYGIDDNLSYPQLEGYLREAWEAVPEHWLRELLTSMPQRYEDVIAAGGWYTPN